MSVQNPHHFSPLWLLHNSKQLNGQRASRSGFATLNGGHVPITRNYSEDVPATIITDINTSFKNRTSEFPSLQSTKPKKSVAVNNGAWSNPRSKAKLYNTVKAQGGTKQPTTPASTKSSRTASGDAEKPNSPKVKVPRSVDSKFDFFKSLRLDEGLIDSDSEKSSYENDCEINGVETAQNPTPLSSSVETEHRLLKEMGWSDKHEPPLTEEEVLSARRDIETHRDMIETKKKAQSPTVLSPFPWAPKIYMPSEDEEFSSDSEDEN